RGRIQDKAQQNWSISRELEVLPFACSRVSGRMTRPADASEPRTESALPLAERATSLSRSLLRELIGVVSRPGILSLAGGLPDPWLFPVTHFSAAMAQ